MTLFEKWILKKMIKYEIVSFDVYDTLIHRIYKEPCDVFREVERKLKYLQCMEEGFYEKRCRAEQMARTNTEKEEITLDDIYQFYETCLDKELLKKLEIETELECIYADKRLKNIFKILKNLNKKILIISDMYLPIEVMEAILKKAGYIGYETIYLSSEILLTKKTGHLFRFALNEMNGQQFIHIGDRFNTDYRNAKKNGLESIWYVEPNITRIIHRFLIRGRNNV